MSLSEHGYTATLVVGGEEYPLGIRQHSGRITLDDAAAPHVQGGFNLALPDEAMQVLLDPRNAARVRIDVSAQVAGAAQTRSFDLGLRSRPIRRGPGGYAMVTLASDEALLGDYRVDADDEAPFDLATSLRDVVDYVLDAAIPGAALEASPAVDADVTAYWPVTLLNYNVSGEVDASGFWHGTGASALTTATMVTPAAVLGTNAVRWTAAAGASSVGIAGWDGVSSTRSGRVTTGKTYTIVAFLCSSISRSATLSLGWRDVNGVSISAVTSAAVVTSNSAWAEISVTGQAPPGAEYAYAAITTTGNGGGEYHFVDAVMLYEGARVIPPFDGSNPSPGYSAAWAGDAHGSQSTRTPDVERDPQSLVWMAGKSALEFLKPLVQAAGLRLVCDGQRHWTLRDESYVADGSLTVREGVNLVDGEDVIDLDGGLWFDARVTIYEWTDRDGVQQRRIDYYALHDPPTLVNAVTINAAYPGPGRSEYAVRRAQTRGREVTATLVADWRTNSEQPTTILLDAAPPQYGNSSRVEFDLSTDRMTVTTKTSEIDEDSWLLGTPDESWLDADDTDTWLEAG